ncbi:MAG: hypothetical protein M1820_002522 [Bogoriella megaspora]|nr:MAG: hypothetical protein M1820_002522 [Bogoriella megaspora]
MGQIYRSATFVLVWLGEYTFGSALSTKYFELLSSVSTSVDFGLLLQSSTTGHPLQTQLRRLSRPFKMDEVLPSDLNFSDGVWFLKLLWMFIHIFRLINLDYFKRSWVVQEIILAQDLRFFIGSTEISLDNMELMFKCFASVLRLTDWAHLSIKGDDSPEGFLEVLRARRERIDGKSWSLENYIALARDRKGSLPEDKIYSILGLVEQDVRSRLLQDTTRAVSEVYVDCTLALVQQTNWLHVLSLVGQVDGGVASIPSWVPDYSTSLRPKPFWYCGCTENRAAVGVPPEFRHTECRNGSAPLLRISVAHIDEVVQIGESSSMLQLVDALTSVSKLYARYRQQPGVFLGSDLDLSEIKHGFVNWLDSTFFIRAEETSSDLNYAMTKFLASRTPYRGERGDTMLNGQPLSRISVLKTFVATHDTAEFPLRKWLSARYYFDETYSTSSYRSKYGIGLKKCKAPAAPGHEPNLPADSNLDHTDKSRKTEYGTEHASMDIARTKQFGIAFAAVYADRRIFRTKATNYIGIAPSPLQNGDFIMLVAGADTPDAFRPVPNQPSYLQLIGQCYIHGLMKGEGLRLPSTEFKTWYIA